MKESGIPSFSFTPAYLTRDSRPWFPLMGEFHYSRVNRDDWRAELLKMKSGGIDIVSTYCIWIHHEEIRGEYDFSGSRDLRRFIETAAACGLFVFLRIGPWAHGEVRNGGFPDWLAEMGRTSVRLRSDDPAYLSEVRRFYGRLFKEAEGLLLKDGGPVIGIQIENEYGHCGGLTGPEGERHMKTLTEMAKDVGFDVPLWTATGWGGAVTGGLLPVMGGYCEAPWDPRVTEIEPSGNYLFTEERNDHAIGSDYGTGEGLTFDMRRFPYLTAELGGGLQVTKHRRPVAGGRDVEAMSVVKLGSGCNLLGYYMYHGGTNPEGRLSTLQESRATGYPNDLPVLSYDFNAPVREYGQLTDTYRRIRALAMFLHDFGEDLCRMEYVPQPGNPTRPGDLTSLRTAVRYDEKEDSGYLFVNNYLRRRTMADHKGVPLAAYGKDSGILEEFGLQDIADGDCFFYPFNMKLKAAPLCKDGARRGGNDRSGSSAPVLLRSAKAVPLCILPGETETTYVFYTKKGVTSPDYRTVGRPEDAGIRILTISEEDALHAVKTTIGGSGYLVISDDDPVITDDHFSFLCAVVTEERRPYVRTFPTLPRCPEGFEYTGSDGCFAVYEYKKTISNPLTVQLCAIENPSGAEISGGTTSSACVKAKIHVSGIRPELAEALLYISYEGESAELAQPESCVSPLRSDRRAADHFYTGQTWEIGVKRFAANKSADFDLTVHPLYPDTPVFLEARPDMESGFAMDVRSLSAAAVLHIPLRLTEET